VAAGFAGLHDNRRRYLHRQQHNGRVVVVRSLRPHERGLMRGPNGEGWVGLFLAGLALGGVFLAIVFKAC
jgi:hypothetical protein